jgi:flagellar biosynthesis protein FlhF
MKIKRYLAADMRQALRQVREAQGPDAVILSTRKVADGVEVVAAVDYDESAPAPAVAPVQRTGVPPGSGSEGPAAAGALNPARDRPGTEDATLAGLRAEVEGIRVLLERQLSGLAWGDLGRRNPQRASVLRSLAELEIHPRLARAIVAQLPAAGSLDETWRAALHLLGERIQVADDDLLDRGGVVALVGSTGVGKTTTVAKLAARFALRHGASQVALLTTDSFRVGAVEQLRTFGRLMGVPVRVVGTRDELGAALEDLGDRRLVLVDTAGMSQRDIRLSEQIAVFQGGSPLVRAYVVLSATAQRPALEEVVAAFRGVPLDGCILTKLDEATGLGALLSVVIAQQLRVAYVSDGQRVPEDLRPARAHHLIGEAVSAMQRQEQTQDDESLELTYGALSAAGKL